MSFPSWQSWLDAQGDMGDQVQDEIDRLRAELARVSEEFGLPPTIGPAPGEIKRTLGEKDNRIAELEAQLTETQECYDAACDAGVKLTAELAEARELVKWRYCLDQCRAAFDAAEQGGEG